MPDHVVCDARTQTMRCKICGDEVPLPTGCVDWNSKMVRAFLSAHRRLSHGRGATSFSREGMRRLVSGGMGSQARTAAGGELIDLSWDDSGAPAMRASVRNLDTFWLVSLLRVSRDADTPPRSVLDVTLDSEPSRDVVDAIWEAWACGSNYQACAQQASEQEATRDADQG